MVDLWWSEGEVRSAMKLLTCFFPFFNRAGLGRKPLSEALRLSRQIRQLDALCLGHLETLLGHGLPHLLRHFKKPSGISTAASAPLLRCSPSGHSSLKCSIPVAVAAVR